MRAKRAKNCNFQDGFAGYGHATALVGVQGGGGAPEAFGI
jgi:hypothetical protein